MAISPKLLGEDEHVVMTLRTHWKVLVLPVLLLIVVAVGGAFLAAIIPDGDWQERLRLAVLAVGVVIVLAGTVRPFLSWLTATYTITNRRMITRRGILNRSGRDIPLFRINDVSYERSLTDRMLGCGTLVFESAGTRGQVLLPDVPHVEAVHLRINEMLFGKDGVHADLMPDRNPLPQAGDDTFEDEPRRR